MCAALAGTALGLVAATFLSPGVRTAAAAAWPQPGRPVTLVVPFSAGGGTDIIARKLAQVLERAVGVPVVVRNVPGAGSAIGTHEVMGARPDGHTLLVSGTHTITAVLQGYTTRGMDALTHVASLNWDPYVIAVNADTPYRTLHELIAGGSRVSFGNAGAGALTHLVSEALNAATRAGWIIVPFEGGARLLTAVLGGHATGGVFSQSEVVGQGGRLRALAVTSARRSPLLPDVPTLSELGIQGIPQGSFRSISAPAGLHPEVRAAIAEAVGHALDDPEFQQFAVSTGLVKEYRVGVELEQYFDELSRSLRELLIRVGAIKP